MAKENTADVFLRLTQVRLRGSNGIAPTCSLDDFPPYVLEQLSEQDRIFLSQSDIQKVMDHTGQFFFKPRVENGLKIFEQIKAGTYRGGGQNGK